MPVAVGIPEREPFDVAVRLAAAAQSDAGPHTDRLRDTAAGHDPAAPDADPATDPRAVNRS
jgi:hypothetical protein